MKLVVNTDAEAVAIETWSRRVASGPPYGAMCLGCRKVLFADLNMINLEPYSMLRMMILLT